MWTTGGVRKASLTSNVSFRFGDDGGEYDWQLACNFSANHILKSNATPLLIFPDTFHEPMLADGVSFPSNLPAFLLPLRSGRFSLRLIQGRQGIAFKLNSSRTRSIQFRY